MLDLSSPRVTVMEMNDRTVSVRVKRPTCERQFAGRVPFGAPIAGAIEAQDQRGADWCAANCGETRVRAAVEIENIRQRAAADREIERERATQEMEIDRIKAEQQIFIAHEMAKVKAKAMENKPSAGDA